MPATSSDLFSQPFSVEGSYRRWSFPVECWSGAKYGEDMVALYHDGAVWSGHTEMDQCVKRDLDDAEIASIRSEMNIT